jgi:thioesterase domain-containing protein
MAQQLQAQGEQVGLVAMLESYNINIVSRSIPRALSLLHWAQNLWFHGANFWAGDEKRWQFIHEKWDLALTRSKVRLGAALHVPSNAGTQNGYPHLLVKRVNDRAVKQYVPRSYSGRVVLIRPKAYFLGLDHPSFGWDEVVRDGLAVREIPIYPKAMLFEPFVQVLAQELGACLREANSK